MELLPPDPSQRRGHAGTVYAYIAISSRKRFGQHWHTARMEVTNLRNESRKIFVFFYGSFIDVQVGAEVGY